MKKTKGMVFLTIVLATALTGCGQTGRNMVETEEDRSVICWFENDRNGGLEGTIVTYNCDERERRDDIVDFRISAQSYVGSGQYVGIIYGRKDAENAIAVYDSNTKLIESIVSTKSIAEHFNGKGCTDNQTIKMSKDRNRLYFQGGGGIIKLDRKSKDMELLAETYTGDFFITPDEEKLYYLRDDDFSRAIVCRNIISGEEEAVIQKVLSFDISADERTIVYSDTNNQLIQYDIETNTTTVIKKGLKPIPKIHLSESGKKVLFTNYIEGLIPGSYKTRLYIYDLKDKTTKCVHKGSYDVAILGTCWIEEMMQ